MTSFGIDSLRALGLIGHVEDDYGVEIPIESLLEDVSLLELAQQIQVQRPRHEAASSTALHTQTARQ